jgi:hypothetical protein
MPLGGTSMSSSAFQHGESQDTSGAELQAICNDIEKLQAILANLQNVNPLR